MNADICRGPYKVAGDRLDLVNAKNPPIINTNTKILP